MLPIHVGAGVVLLVAAFVALVVSKGGLTHRCAGRWFLVAMLLTVVSAAIFDLSNREFPAIPLLAGYLAATSWATVRKPPGSIDVWDKFTFAAIMVIALVLFFRGWSLDQPGRGAPPGMYFVFGAIALACATFDYINIRRGGHSGRLRILRHLWRMFAPLIMAVMSLLSQKSVVPEHLWGTLTHWSPVIFLLGLMVFWLLRVAVGGQLHPITSRRE